MGNFQEGFHNGFWDRHTTDLSKIGDPEYMAGHLWGEMMGDNNKPSSPPVERKQQRPAGPNINDDPVVDLVKGIVLIVMLIAVVASGVYFCFSLKQGDLFMHFIMFDESYFQLYKAFLIVMLILVVIAVAVALFIERRKAKERRDICEFYASLAPLKAPKAEAPESTPSPLKAPKVDVPKSTSSPLKVPKASHDV